MTLIKRVPKRAVIAVICALLAVPALITGRASAQTAPAPSAYAAAPDTSSDCSSAAAQAQPGGQYVCVAARPRAYAAAPDGTDTSDGSSAPAPTAYATAPDSTPDNFPSYCRPDTTVVASRYQACDWATYDIEGFDADTHALIATMSVRAIAYTTTQRNNARRSWTMITKIKMLDITGEFTTGCCNQIMTQFICAGGTSCAVTALGGNNWTNFNLGQPLAGAYMFSSPGVAKDFVISRHLLSFKMATPAGRGPWQPNPLTVSSVFPTIRCDNTIDSGSCVFSDFWPNFDTIARSNPAMKDAANFMFFAQIVIPKHPGVVGNFPLSRDTNKDDIALARQISCQGFVKDPTVPNDSCDEYPFASTFQSALYAANGDWRVGHVPLPQNSLVGSLLSAFYTTQHVINGDNFWMTIKP